jgi:toxin ParE1/3/4
VRVPVVWTAAAAADLEIILDYIETESPRDALIMALAIRQGANALLGEYPEIGRRGRAASTRELVIARTPFVVVYRVQKKPARVEIIRVLHGAQKWPPSPPSG